MTTSSTPSNTDAYAYPLGLFDAYGVELEYMIVDSTSLDVRPLADELFALAAGHATSEVEPDGPDGPVSWSNELALHVVELKTARPTPTLDHLAEQFQSHVCRINGLLAPMGCRLLPTGMHPWMDPDRETRLWPHECNEIYAAYDRIFSCRGHGWSNLQSTHINLPFANDEEFGRLHAAIRLVLALLPGLAASSPFADGQRASFVDNRLEVYRHNADRIPSMNGLLIPEPVFTRQAYERDILGRIFEDLAPHDPAGVLRDEFANARGAMPRFVRGSIEIRLLDIQECPAADLAIVELVTAAVRATVEERWISYDDQRRIATEPLHGVLLDTIRHAENATITERPLLDAFGIGAKAATCGEVWSHIAGDLARDGVPWCDLVRRMIDAGSLASRINRSLADAPSRDALRAVYAELADDLQHGRLFRAV